MAFKHLAKRIWRFYKENSGAKSLLNYYRKQGMRIGNNCHIGRLIYTDEAYLIEIGDHVAIAAGVLLITHDPGLWCFSLEAPTDDIFGKITIGNNVLIGMRSVILPNTTIGNNCIIGAGSVVRGKFPENSVIFGNPAKIVSNLAIQKLIYSNHPGRLSTAQLTDKRKTPIVKKHFGIT